MDWEHPSDDTIDAAKLGQLAEEYDATAKAVRSRLAASARSEPTVQERDLAIPREFDQARKDLKGNARVLSDGKAGSVNEVGSMNFLGCG